MLLLGAVVNTFAGNSQTEFIAIKREAVVGVVDRDRRVIDAEKQSVALRQLVPFLRSLPFRKLQDLEHVVVGILEVERPYTGSRGDVCGQSLRAGRGVLHFVCTKKRVSLVDVRNDDRDVLKPSIVTSRVDRDRTSLRSEILGELEEFRTELESHDTRTCAENSGEMLEV